MLELIKAYSKLTNGKCGLRITDFKGDLNKIRSELNKLYKEGKIEVRNGVNSKLIFLK